MFTRYGKKENLVHRKSVKDLTQISKPEFILAEEKRAALMLQIEQACVLGTERFYSLCATLVSQLINHCQLLPDTANNYYSQPGGLLDHALNRTEAALALFKQFVLLDDGQGEWSEEQKLWQYVLYSAAMLQGIGKLQIDYLVKLYDGNGQFLTIWNPLLGSFASAGSYYSYEFEKETEVNLRRRLNLLLARMVMPAAGFAWIASNREALGVWLALLNEDYQGAGTLGAILIRANAIALRRYFNQLLARDANARGQRHRVSTFVDTTPESIDDLEEKIGAKFLQWLAKAIESGVLMINKAPLLSVPGGMLMCPDVFKLFIRESSDFKNWLAIQTGFLSLGLHQIGPKGETDFRVEKNTGVDFSDYAMVLPDEVTYQTSSGESKTVSAVEFIFQAEQMGGVSNPISHLAASGKWQSAPVEQKGPSLGMTTRG